MNVDSTTGPTVSPQRPKATSKAAVPEKILIPVESKLSSPEGQRLLDAIHGILKLTMQLAVDDLSPDGRWVVQRLQSKVAEAMEAAAIVLNPGQDTSMPPPPSSGQSSSTPTTSPPPSQSSSDDWRVHGSPPRILLAEDNPVNRELFTRVLAPLGCLVAVAKDGNEAVTLAKSQPFDLILMDVQMPDKDGMTATRELREHFLKTGQHVPIVAVTANVFDGSREACLAAGMDDFLTKPLRPQELIHTLGRYLNPARRPQSVRNEPLASLPPEDAQILRTLIPLFLEEAQSAIDRMPKAVQKLDRRTLQDTAYRIKGSLVVFRESELAALAANIEMASETESAETLQALVDKMVHTLREALPRWESSQDVQRP